VPFERRSSTPLRFGPFEVDPIAGELRKQGVRIKLQEQPLQILQVLLERPGDVITREELRQRLWAADTFVDFDHGLYNAIKRLREALGDVVETPRFIETVPKRGYRLIAPVISNGHLAGQEQVSVAGISEISSSYTPSQTRPRRKALFVLVGAGSLVLVFTLFVGLNLGGAGILVRAAWAKPPQIHSIAVLPLKNLSNDAGQEYFADGMTEELITELSGISALKIISRTTVMRYKQSNQSLPEIARELRVDGIVEGSVVRNGNEVRVTAQLIYAPEDKNIWARSYERQFQDSLTLQSEVASAIVGAIRAKIEPAEQTRLQTARSASDKALEAYFQGIYHFDHYGFGFGPEEADRALEYFRQAIAEDPDFAPAYESMAEVYSEKEILAPQAQTVPLIRAVAEKASALDPNSSEAHFWLAKVKAQYDWDWQGAEREYRRAIELNPNDTLAHEFLGGYLLSMGRIEEGLKEQERAQELDPVNWHMLGLYEVRRYDEAIKMFTKSLESAPEDGRAHFWLSESYAQKGMYKEAFQHLRLTVALFGLKEIADSMDRGYAASGYKGAMQELAKGTEQLHARHQFTSQWIARFYVRLGDNEQALKWLQQDYKEREDDGLVGLNVDPVWDPLRSDARFQDLVRRVGLPDVNVAVASNHQAKNS
jgi:TolB-like protein/DNA-binding winged helix-turn-helix (wHTH) protein/Tfp pilus assembly protein PilF